VLVLLLLLTYFSFGFLPAHDCMVIIPLVPGLVSEWFIFVISSSLASLLLEVYHSYLCASYTFMVPMVKVCMTFGAWWLWGGKSPRQCLLTHYIFPTIIWIFLTSEYFLAVHWSIFTITSLADLTPLRLRGGGFIGINVEF